MSNEEHVLQQELKFKCLGLASLGQSIASQRSRLTFLKEEDANTKFFHLQACHHGHKSFFNRLHHQGATVVHESNKAHVMFDRFDVILGAPFDLSISLDFSLLNVPTVDQTEMDFCFSEHEIWQVIREMTPDKPPGPDGFTGLFYQSAWPIIKFDIMQVLHAFWQLDFHSFHLVNQAYMVLLRRKPDVDQVQDVCLISLVHSLSKLISKTLA
jgi:hypothetical protein